MKWGGHAAEGRAGTKLVAVESRLVHIYIKKMFTVMNN